jgi:2-C-methyl-D-erythritol 4-phosphate cytidylyltransferase
VDDVWAIVVAAGRGDRFGGPKQFWDLDGERLVDRAAGAAVRTCDHVVVVLPPDVEWDGPPVTATVPGGETRSASVRAGLNAIPETAEIVVVHDAARPLAPDRLFKLMIATIRLSDIDGVVPIVAVTDTLKRVDGSRVVETLDRSVIRAVQTPQVFRGAVLRRAHASGSDASDDAALVEAIGGRVAALDGVLGNIKITSHADLDVAAMLLTHGLVV